MATTYYVDKAVGADGNLGTSEGAGNAWETLDKAMNTVAAGDKVHVKASAEYDDDNGSGVCATIDTVGTNAAPIWFEGYTDTPGDGGSITINGTNNTLASGINYTGSSTVYYVFHNFIIKNGTAAAWSSTSGDGLVLYNCEADNNGGEGVFWDRYVVLVNCKLTNNTYGARTGLFCGAVACVAYGNSAINFDMDHAWIVACLGFDGGATSEGVRMSSPQTVPGLVYGCTLDGEGHATGRGISVSNYFAAIVNNIAYDWETGIHGDADRGQLRLAVHNLVNSNSGADYTNVESAAGSQTGAPAFVDEAGDDYRLGGASPARAAGLDASVASGGTSYVDIGARQHLAGIVKLAGAGGGLVG